MRLGTLFCRNPIGALLLAPAASCHSTYPIAIHTGSTTVLWSLGMSPIDQAKQHRMLHHECNDDLWQVGAGNQQTVVD